MFRRILDFFVVTNAEEGSYTPTVAGNAALIVIIALLFTAILVIGKKNKSEKRKTVDVKQLVLSAVAIALSVVASQFTVLSLPYGGSITLFRMFFICIIGYLYGTKSGVLTGVACGLLDLILKPYVYYPVQLLLDYPLAFGCLGLSGVFAKAKYGMIKGYILGVAGRYLCHTLSGLLFFSAYAGDQNPVIYSVVYNATYIVPEAVLTIALLLIPAVQNGIAQVKRIAVE